MESYGFLQQDHAERSVKILEQISLQLSSFSTNTIFVNSTTPPLPCPEFIATKTDITINIMWFLSLTLALMAALFSILAQQWIRHYADLPLVTGRERAQIRQTRSEALERWLIPQIIKSLALLLQAALFLFLFGLVVLLWKTNPAVAKATTSTIAIFISAFLLTIILPAFSADCPYKSPLASGVRSPVVAVVWLPFMLFLAILLALFDLVSGLDHNGWLRSLRDQMELCCGGNWHAVEEKSLQIVDKAHLDCRSINWAARTAKSISNDDLIACLLESCRPHKALITWVAFCVDSTADKIWGAIQNKMVKNHRLFSDSVNQSVASALMLSASIELEQVSHHRATRLSDENNSKKTAEMVDVVIWINSLGFRSQYLYNGSWAYLSAAVKALDFVGHEQHLLPMLEKILRKCRRQRVISNPVDPAWCELKSSSMAHKVLIYMYSQCASHQLRHQTGSGNSITH